MQLERFRRQRPMSSPHDILAIGSMLVLVLEALRGSDTVGTSLVWPLAQALVSGTALLIAWRSRDRLRLGPILLLGLAFHLAWIGLHLHLGVTGDHDPVNVYPVQGDVVLHGGYPRSEYPPGAVALFALETWLGGGAARTTNALLMIPFQLVCVISVWTLRTRWTPWLTAVVALWPLNAFYWEFRFDLVATAALLAGLALARRERWWEAGLVLGFGAAVKWSPALTCAALILWLLRSRRFAEGSAHLVGFSIPVLLANVPLLLVKPSDALAAYKTQSARTVTGESFPYLPLRLFWDARPGRWYFDPADVSAEANRAAVWLQVVAVLGVIVLAGFATTRSSAIALAGLAPAVFFLTNRIFSPQFFVLILAAVVAAAALVVRTRSELFGVVGACAVATTANTVLYQSFLALRPVATVPGWALISAIVFLPTIAAAVWLIVRAKLQTIETPLNDQSGRGRASPLTT